jgi:hypothetical protein
MGMGERGMPTRRTGLTISPDGRVHDARSAACDGPGLRDARCDATGAGERCCTLRPRWHRLGAGASKHRQVPAERPRSRGRCAPAHRQDAAVLASALRPMSVAVVSAGTSLEAVSGQRRGRRSSVLYAPADLNHELTRLVRCHRQSVAVRTSFGRPVDSHIRSKGRGHAERHGEGARSEQPAVRPSAGVERRRCRSCGRRCQK